jgi:hypothetical protein
LRTRWTRRSEFVNTPSFSANTADGKTTSAKRAVSFMNGSWMARNSSLFMPRSSTMQLGSESTMSSPMTNRPRICLPTTFIISFRFSPGTGESLAPQAASYLRCTSGSSTRW